MNQTIRKEVGSYRDNRINSSPDVLMARIARVTSGPEMVEVTKIEQPRMTLAEEANKKLQDRIEASIESDVRRVPHLDVQTETGEIVDQKAYLARELWQKGIADEKAKRDSFDFEKLTRARLAVMGLDPDSYTYSSEYQKVENDGGEI